MRVPPARATTGLVALTAATFVIVSLLMPASASSMLAGFIPARASGATLAGAVPVWLTPLSATLLHAGVVHLGMNMLMLGFCGREIEPAIGARGTLGLYLVSAYAAAAAQWAWSPHATTPMVGASGATSGVLAAYALLYGERRLRVSHAGLSRWLNIAWLAAAWIGINLMVGLASKGAGFSVAVPAHVGGFVAGLLLTRPLLKLRFARRPRG